MRARDDRPHLPASSNHLNRAFADLTRNRAKLCSRSETKQHAIMQRCSNLRPGPSRAAGPLAPLSMTQASAFSKRHLSDRCIHNLRPVLASASPTDHNDASTSGASHPPPLPPIPVPKPVSVLLKSLQDFGIGKNSLKEGGVGLFLMGGCAAAVGLLAWARGNAMRVGTPYHLTVQLPLACGITIGTPVRGVCVYPSLPPCMHTLPERSVCASLHPLVPPPLSSLVGLHPLPFSSSSPFPCRCASGGCRWGRCST